MRTFNAQNIPDDLWTEFNKCINSLGLKKEPVKTKIAIEALRKWIAENKKDEEREGMT